MSLAVVYSRALAGLDAPLVRVEVHVGGGLPETHIVGLPEKEVREARDRVRAALSTSRFDRPDGRVTINLAPADLPKESGRFDLPIAIGILGLSGELRAIRGALAMTYRAHRDGRAFVLPEAVAAEAALAKGQRSFRRAPCSTSSRTCTGSRRSRLTRARANPSSPAIPISATCAARRRRGARSR